MRPECSASNATAPGVGAGFGGKRAVPAGFTGQGAMSGAYSTQTHDPDCLDPPRRRIAGISVQPRIAGRSAGVSIMGVP
jgi:hypothetical protein